MNTFAMINTIIVTILTSKVVGANMATDEEKELVSTLRRSSFVFFIIRMDDVVAQSDQHQGTQDLHSTKILFEYFQCI